MDWPGFMFLNLDDLLALLSLQRVSAYCDLPHGNRNYGNAAIYTFQMHLDTSSRLESWVIQQLAFGSMWLSTWNGDQASKCVWESAVIVARAA